MRARANNRDPRLAHSTGERTDLNWTPPYATAAAGAFEPASAATTDHTHTANSDDTRTASDDLGRARQKHAGSDTTITTDIGCHIRQTFYAAFMLRRGNEAMLAAQRNCREVGVHPPWAAETHARLECGSADGE